MRLRTFLKPLSFIPALLLMYMIFSFSAQEADVSSELSYRVSRRIVQTADHVLNMDLEEYQIDNYAVRINGITRKLAHMGEYFLLAIAVSFPLYVYGLHGILLVLVAGMFCVAFACSDEYHQSLVAGRAAQLRDVGIDSVGILFGIILVRIIGWTGRMTVFRQDPYEAEQRRIAKTRRKYEKRMAARERELERSYEQFTQDMQDMRPVESSRHDGSAGYQGTSPGRPDEGAAPGTYRSGQRQNAPVRRPGGRIVPGPEPDDSADPLADDMPFSHIFKPKD